MNVYLCAEGYGHALPAMMQSLGVDPAGTRIMREKGSFCIFRITGIAGIAANILKQEMLSRGGDVAIPRDALYGSAKKADVLIFGTRRQFSELIQKLTLQPFGLKNLGQQIKRLFNDLDHPVTTIRIGKKTFNTRKRTICMGILNVTPDSFSDGGQFMSKDAAVAHAGHMCKDGADIIDIGAESSRPGAAGITAGEELKRLLPVVNVLRKDPCILMSIDTTRAAVAEACLKAGAHMINDISGLKADKKMARVIAHYNVPVVIMHRSGSSHVMQKRTRYKDVVRDIIDALRESMEIGLRAGIARDRIIIDPGIGFGKTTEQNLEIIKRLSEFKVLGLPILIGASRKSVIGTVLKLDVTRRLEGTLALTAVAIQNGASIIRVHDVKENQHVITMCDAVRNITLK